ncbi:hypothetical protein SAMD00019534_074990 [Acytostelium subglobosum LB1]|uniref:hypothetical protein n=1 Tax=Acytostelium subglobosum LB1 TaxID=1410327 RepID=UPI000644EDC8|nr:hypothetical protein SAMD00019534_074990 [Acytostelium subglobosum LB1]GAM24324.1 hypothetical protein SAMD00019534_074990 [Acytostelium subglobosum LB1]|eukprot:XP_012752650.1 hypothetical protein SAMD00019534_074990 [Acytostelium subglobosum LB1]
MSHHYHHHHHRKSTCVAYLLWFFFGIFGAHRFYLHKNGSGFIYLFTLGICGIGWLVDLFCLRKMVKHYNKHHFADETLIVAPAPIMYHNQQPFEQYAYPPPQVQQLPYGVQPQQYQPYQPMMSPYGTMPMQQPQQPMMMMQQPQQGMMMQQQPQQGMMMQQQQQQQQPQAILQPGQSSMGQIPKVMP